MFNNVCVLGSGESFKHKKMVEYHFLIQPKNSSHEK